MRQPQALPSDLRRQYCARRITRIRARKSVKLIQRSGKKYNPRPVNEDNVSEETLLLQLVDCERAWAYSQQLLEEVSDSNLRRAGHALRRIRKAVHSAATLQALCEQSGSQRTQVEASAYYHMLNASLQMQLQMWEDALRSLVSAMSLLEQVASIGSTLHQRAVAVRLEEMTANIRLCSYKLDTVLGSGAAKAIMDEINAENQTSSVQGALSAAADGQLDADSVAASLKLGSIKFTWNDTQFTVNQGRVAAALQRANNALATYVEAASDASSAGDVGYVGGLTALDEALAAAKGVQPQTAEYEALQAAITCVKLQVQHSHNCSMLRRFQVACDTPHVLAAGDGALPQVQSDVARLRGVLGRAVGTMQELEQFLSQGEASAALLQLVQSSVAGLQALRGDAVARGQALHALHTDKSAGASAAADGALQTTTSALSEASAAVSACTAAPSDLYCGLLVDSNLSVLVGKHVKVLGSRALAESSSSSTGLLVSLRCQSQMSAGGTQASSGAPACSLLDSLLFPGLPSEARAGAHAVLAQRRGLPSLLPLPMKPITFDVAHDFVGIPSVAHRVPGASAPSPAPASGAAATDTEEKGAVGGLLSWFTG